MRVGILLLIYLLFSTGCTKTVRNAEAPQFTKADTLMDQLLVLQDSLHHRWLRVSMYEQLHNDYLKQLFQKAVSLRTLPAHEHIAIDQQIIQLQQIQLNPRNMANPDVIREHDLARHALTTDIFLLVDLHDLHLKDSGIAHLARQIQGCQDATWTLRQTYDSLAHHYNQFLYQHREALVDHDPAAAHLPRPLFGAVFKK
jgi:hypothetical protein